MTRPPLKVGGAITLESRSGAIGHPRWLTLLEQVGATGSISAAARAAGMSYKAAWDAIDSLNNVAGNPVVATAVGGKGGGGAKLTARGRSLVTTWRAVETENQRFLADVNAKLRHAERDLRVLGRLSMRTSARNHWSGTVSRLVRGAVNDEVELELPGGDRIVAIVTHDSAEALGLAPGVDAFALVKASSVMLGRVEGDGRLALSARNQLRGRVSRATPGAVNTEVVVALRAGATVTAIVTCAAAEELGFAEGDEVLAIFKASSVILGRD